MGCSPVEVVIDAAGKVLCCLYVKKQYRGEATVKASLATCHTMLPLLPAEDHGPRQPSRPARRMMMISVEDLANITFEVHRRLPAGRLEWASTLQQLVDDVAELIVSSE
ncbi:hypothetical protein FOZ60_014543 [Perkinsus olseni]|uniref:Uncharacterized protein n=1 Tax=Perkinsus olseni TaxID=32597 RepID=A0A7J6NA51_PEROL|nr:hypothetical protein FOZ60_014543 [Perkinsus olseni]